MATAKPKFNSICHTEIPVTDLKKAKTFYGKLFNWKVQILGDNYAIYQDGVTGGGFNKVNKKPKESNVTPYVWVKDINKALDRAKKLGGKVVFPKTKIEGGDWGYCGQITDPFGNKVGLWSRG